MRVEIAAADHGCVPCHAGQRKVCSVECAKAEVVLGVVVDPDQFVAALRIGEQPLLEVVLHLHLARARCLGFGGVNMGRSVGIAVVDLRAPHVQRVGQKIRGGDASRSPLLRVVKTVAPSGIDNPVAGRVLDLHLVGTLRTQHFRRELAIAVDGNPRHPEKGANLARGNIGWLNALQGFHVRGKLRLDLGDGARLCQFGADGTGEILLRRLPGLRGGVLINQPSQILLELLWRPAGQLAHTVPVQASLLVERDVERFLGVADRGWNLRWPEHPALEDRRLLDAGRDVLGLVPLVVPALQAEE